MLIIECFAHITWLDTQQAKKSEKNEWPWDDLDMTLKFKKDEADLLCLHLVYNWIVLSEKKKWAKGHAIRTSVGYFMKLFVFWGSAAQGQHFVCIVFHRISKLLSCLGQTLRQNVFIPITSMAIYLYW